MKPGATKLKDYLKAKQEYAMSVADYREIDSKWTSRTLKRIVEEHPELFQITEGKVSLLVKKTTNYEEYKATRLGIVNKLENFLVGPFEDDEILGQRKRPM